MTRESAEQAAGSADPPERVGPRARDAKARVAFDPGTVERFRLIGHENREVADGDFRDAPGTAARPAPATRRTALCAVRAGPGAGGHPATACVRRLDPGTAPPAACPTSRCRRRPSAGG
ncbi:YfbK domain-containing protein [Streptomyces sp. G44]|uniref:YfbK domain-containing protein n=1 Tax=Streptomyces sp. G44 TaxID=2807632 RepID=UPI001EF89C21|nr:YfbK domain-containing protein [Streptomyces sp. G44]